MSTYLKMMTTGRYEYGVIQYNNTDRRKDRLVKVGEVETYAEAASIIALRKIELAQYRNGGK